MTEKEIIFMIILVITLAAIITLLGYAMIKTANVEEENKKLQNQKLKEEIRKLKHTNENLPTYAEFMKAQAELMKKRAKK